MDGATELVARAVKEFTEASITGEVVEEKEVLTEAMELWLRWPEHKDTLMYKTVEFVFNNLEK